MANNDQYVNDLEKYLNSDEDILEPEEVVETPKGLKGNITTDEVRDTEQALLYLVVDKSGSMYNNGLEKAVVDGLNIMVMFPNLILLKRLFQQVNLIL